MARKKEPKISEAQVVEKIVEIAFSAEAKDADRLRALDWLSEFLWKRSKTNEVLDRLDEILRKVKGED